MASRVRTLFQGTSTLRKAERHDGLACTRVFYLATLPLMLATLFSGMSIAAKGETDAERAKRHSDAICEKVLCRAPTTVRVTLEDGRIKEVPILEPTAIVLPNSRWVTILMGEEVHIVLNLEGSKIKGWRAVEPDTVGPNMLTFKLKQVGRDGQTSLEVQSTVAHDVKFRLTMMRPDNGDLFKTSSCPVRTYNGLYEHWPHPIFQLIIKEFRILGASEERVCE